MSHIDQSMHQSIQARNMALLSDNPDWISELVVYIYDRLPPEFQEAVSGAVVNVMESERGPMLIMKISPSSRLFTSPLVEVFGILCDTITAVTGITQIAFQQFEFYWVAYRVYDVWMLMSEDEFQSSSLESP